MRDSKLRERARREVLVFLPPLLSIEATSGSSVEGLPPYTLRLRGKPQGPREGSTTIRFNGSTTHTRGVVRSKAQ